MKKFAVFFRGDWGTWTCVVEVETWRQVFTMIGRKPIRKVRVLTTGQIAIFARGGVL